MFLFCFSWCPLNVELISGQGCDWYAAYVAAADGKQDKPQNQPAAVPASTSRVKAETDRSVEELIQPKKAAAPTKAGKCRLQYFVFKLRQ